MNIVLLARKLCAVITLGTWILTIATACVPSGPVPPTATHTIAPSPSPSSVASRTPTLVNSPTKRPATVTVSPTNTRSVISVPQVNVLIDSAKQYQTIEGFGATTVALVYDGGVGDTLSPALRAKAIDAVYNQVKITMGNLNGGLLESPGDYSQRRDDDDDPFNFNWSGFQTKDADAVKHKVIDLATPLGFNNYFLSQNINTRWASPWLDDMRKTDYNRFLDEAAEQVAAGAVYWRNTYGIVPPYQQIFNEPLSGNGELLDGTTQDVVNIIKRAGARLRREGLNTKFLLNEATEEQSLYTATAILADPEARQYLGVIGYHTYPYGSTYASVPNILSTSGSGKPNADRIAIRNQLRDLSKKNGLALWMTEVSHGDVDPRSFDDFLGRAIHIHDEFVYADAAAYFGMMNIWDSTSWKLHSGSANVFDSANEGDIVLIDNPNNTVTITGMGYAIGQYARWVKKGATRIDATSSDPLVQVTSFLDKRDGRLVLVTINNATTDRAMTVNVKGLKMNGSLSGEQSTRSSYWSSLPSTAPDTSDSYTLVLPPKSVTTIAVQTVR